MSQRTEFEQDLRAALLAEAEAGPDYEAALHGRVMARVHAAVGDGAHEPASAATPTGNRAGMLMMAGLGVILLLVLVALIVAHR